MCFLFNHTCIFTVKTSKKPVKIPGRQRKTEEDRGRQRKTEEDRGRQRKTEEDRGRQQYEISKVSCNDGQLRNKWNMFDQHVAMNSYGLIPNCFLF